MDNFFQQSPADYLAWVEGQTGSDLFRMAVGKWKHQYPALKVEQEIDGLREWLERNADNPQKRRKNLVRWVDQNLARKEAERAGKGKPRNGRVKTQEQLNNELLDSITL